MKTEDILRIQKLAARIRSMSVISQEGKLHELGEDDILELLEMQQEQASEIERIANRALKSITVR
ncbi:hypothetical protein ACXHQL_24570 [Vibrio parahaemolyticus]|uniref:hypothetical protein n=1 Tax=Vibrio TaxID=662 RepID=UPI00177EB37C|nr:hypothetical protein [Vibrio parahaemolyticus]MBD6969334.1 hypothetical protein [Vibrio parahaemolyticus]MBD6973579.1 hypothetical protein [Vibrio parahaemolyticus]MBD6984142.1 hypothetical protein [Vibrio parahaemolyticus]MBD6988084.1 hypothetical protein [Vibrio parahaemolyticus]MCC3813447.1 hypothetical protein [Vibrio parahaemolyticus]